MARHFHRDRDRSPPLEVSMISLLSQTKQHTSPGFNQETGSGIYPARGFLQAKIPSSPSFSHLFPLPLLTDRHFSSHPKPPRSARHFSLPFV
jgi:hypothetical protein